MALLPPLPVLRKLVGFYARFTPSFTRVGYVARGLSLRPLRADLSGRTWLVTGASGGLGRAACLEAAARGARVFAVARNIDALRGLAMEAAGLSGEIKAVACDLSSMAAVSRLAFASELTGATIDVLVNNVGVLLRDPQITSEGLETSYATNLLGHYILTETLAAAGKLAEHGVIINVVSGGLYNAPLNTKLLDVTDPKTFNGFAAYGSHKRAQLALADRWRRAFTSLHLHTYAVHPGWADTVGVRVSLPKFRRVLRPILRSPRQGVDTLVWLGAKRPVQAEDQVWFDRKPRTAHVYPATRTALATSDELIAYLERDRRRLEVTGRSAA